MKLFVTGGTGFIGSHFLNAAIASGHEVIALRRSKLSTPKVFLNKDPIWLDKAMVEVNSGDFKGCDVLIHLASAGVTPQPAEWELCYRVNVLETLHLVEAALEAHVDRIVATGSYAEYGFAGLRYDAIPPDAPLEPTDSYAASKASGSVMLCSLSRARKFKLNYLRLFSVFGEGQHEQNFWPQLRRAARAGEDFPMTEGDQVRDFVPVETVASQLVEACSYPNLTPGEPRVANLASGQPVTLRGFAETWWKRFKATGRLLIGAVPARPNEVKRYVPLIEP